MTQGRVVLDPFRALLAERAVRRAAIATGVSILFIFTVAGVTFQAAGVHPSYGTGPVFPSWGEFGSTLAASSVRWDSVPYAAIATDGYTLKAETAWFPLYPTLMGLLGRLIGSVLLAGLGISIVSMLVGFAVLHRLTEMELGSAAADRVVWLAALFPSAVFFPAVLTEALFFALTVSAFYCARKKRWALAGCLGAAAALTRNTGVLLFIPLALFYLSEGYSGDEEGEPRKRRGDFARLVRPDGAVLLLVPLALAAFCAYCWIAWGDPLSTWHAQDNWQRGFHGPFAGAWFAAQDAWQQTAHIVRHGTDWTGVLSYGHDSYWAVRAIREFWWVAFVAVSVVGAFRRLPPPYGVYALAAAGVALTGVNPEAPLNWFARYVLVLFPLQMWLASWTDESTRYRTVLTVSVALLAFYTAEIANGRSL